MLASDIASSSSLDRSPFMLSLRLIPFTSSLASCVAALAMGRQALAAADAALAATDGIGSTLPKTPPFLPSASSAGHVAVSPTSSWCSFALVPVERKLHAQKPAMAKMMMNVTMATVVPVVCVR